MTESLTPEIEAQQPYPRRIYPLDARLLTEEQIAALTPEEKAQRMVAIMEALTERPDVTGQFMYNFQDGPDRNDPEHNLGLMEYGLRDGQYVPKLVYWATREYLTNQPAPSDE